MLYYRLYKRMRKKFLWWSSPIAGPPDFALFVLLIPAISAAMLIGVLNRHFSLSQELQMLIVFLFIGGAGLYLWLCQKYDKEP
jgi:hypothetical protein